VVTLIVTCRSDEALDAPVARWVELPRRPETARLDLTGLSRVAMAELAEGALGTGPHEAVIDELQRRTEGNPYFAEELLAAAVAADGARPDVVLTRQPPRALADLLVARSRRAGDAARAALAVLAVAGRPIPETVVGRVTGATTNAPRRTPSSMRRHASTRTCPRRPSTRGCSPTRPTSRGSTRPTAPAGRCTDTPSTSPTGAAPRSRPPTR
jgi:hypothetical protein